MLADRATSRIAFVVATEGGMDIERWPKNAGKNREKDRSRSGSCLIKRVTRRERSGLKAMRSA